MVDELLDSPTFTARMRELVILRVAYLQRSSYQLGQHLDVGRAAGIPAHQLDALTGNDLAVGGFDATEQAVLEFVTELCTTNHVRDDVFAATRDPLGEPALAELLMLVSLYYGPALVLNTADLELDKTIPAAGLRPYQGTGDPPMTRIALRDIATMTEPASKLILERGNLNVYRALANAEPVFTGGMTAGRAALTSPVLGARLRELVILRVGHLMDSPYEIAQHTTVAQQAG